MGLRSGKYGKNGQPKPVSEGQEIELSCIGTGKNGDGVFKEQGFVIFVKGAEVGKRYLLSITEMRSRMAFAEIIKPL